MSAIRYENSVEDVVAFQRQLVDRSPSLRRQLAKNRWGWTIAFPVIMVGILQLIDPHGLLSTKVVFSIAGSVLFFLYFGITVKRNIGRMSRKLFEEGQNRAFLGWHELDAEPEGLVARSAYAESKIAWGVVEKVETTQSHTFIYVGATAAHVIPHAAITSGDYKAFMADIKDHFKPDHVLPSEMPTIES